MGVYLHEISKTPLLDAAAEVDLAKAVEAGLYAQRLINDENIPPSASELELDTLAFEGKKAKEQFIKANLRLVVSIARRYVRSGMPMLDLIQEGNTGLVRAVEKFDYQRGFKFSTYATWWIRQGHQSCDCAAGTDRQAPPSTLSRTSTGCVTPHAS